MALQIERVFERSHIRRGRLATAPVFAVVTPDESRWVFRRRRDAAAFIANGGACRDHRDFACEFCNGRCEAPPDDPCANCRALRHVHLAAPPRANPPNCGGYKRSTEGASMSPATAMLWGFLYAAGFDAREKRRPTPEQFKLIAVAEKRRAGMGVFVREDAVKTLEADGLVEWREGRWTITEKGRKLLASKVTP